LADLLREKPDLWVDRGDCIRAIFPAWSDLENTGISTRREIEPRVLRGDRPKALRMCALEEIDVLPGVLASGRSRKNKASQKRCKDAVSNCSRLAVT
jgi:hypothetical protein